MNTENRRGEREPSARVRWRVLRQFEDHLDVPMAVLGLVWLCLFILDVVRGLNPLLTGLSTIIWVLFAADFLLRLALAPVKLVYLRRSWLTALSIMLPALRIAQVARAAPALRSLGAVRGVRLVRTVTSFNRGMRALADTTRRGGLVSTSWR